MWHRIFRFRKSGNKGFYSIKALIFLLRKVFIFPGRILLLQLALPFFLFFLFLCQFFLALFK